MGQTLSKAEVEAYWETGFHSPVRIFSPDEAAALRRALEAEENKRGPIFREDRPRPGDPFWTERTLRRAQERWADWDMAPYRAALAVSA